MQYTPTIMFLLRRSLVPRRLYPQTQSLLQSYREELANTTEYHEHANCQVDDPTALQLAYNSRQAVSCPSRIATDNMSEKSMIGMRVEVLTWTDWLAFGD